MPEQELAGKITSWMQSVIPAGQFEHTIPEISAGVEERNRGKLEVALFSLRRSEILGNRLRGKTYYHFLESLRSSPV